MAEYLVTVHEGTEPITSPESFFIEDRAKRRAVKLSRDMTGTNVTVHVTSERSGYPKVYRMGRLYKP